MKSFRKQKIFHGFCLVVSAAIVVYEYYLYKLQVPSTSFKLARDHTSRDDDSFLSDWCRLQRSRLDWKGLLGNCRNKSAWEHKEKESTNRTDGDKSFISRWKIKPQVEVSYRTVLISFDVKMGFDLILNEMLRGLRRNEEKESHRQTRALRLSGDCGEFSRFFIQSVTSYGLLKRFGGDSWRVYIRKGPASLAPMVIDHNNGTYEVVFLALEPGNYSAQVFLDYTLCDGFRDPPQDWFINGNIHGYEQEHGILGDISNDYINAPLQNGRPVEFYVKESSKTNGFFKYIQTLINGSREAHPSLLSCNVDCRLLWNGFGRWINKTWKPYIPEDDGKIEQTRSPQLKTLTVYGDSIAVHYHAISKRRRLCKEMFHACDKKYMWVYNADLSGNDNNDFDQSIVLEEIKESLARPGMSGKESVFLFNVGIHYSLVLNFTTYKRLIGSVITMLTRRTGAKFKRELGSQALRIWRSSTFIEREHLKKMYTGDNLTKWRFHTSPRVQLFHTYATNAMCMAGIPVLDMYPLTAAWPHGTRDHIHYSDDVIEPAVKVLERYLSEQF
ncbi:hypothetical protein ACROYT_G017195 [Oculina patagonica]